MIHLGKHGNLEWLPGKNAGLSASCAPDAALGDLPLIYPFLVNDPGEGTQAKRRVHATLVDHLVPPMARAESYGDIARLEQLLDEYAAISAMDPAKLPAIRAQIWTLIQAAKLDHDLGLEDRPDDEGFDDFLLHVDGWLCEIKDAQIRDGLHVLGGAPDRPRPRQPRPGHPARPADLGRYDRPARPARGARPGRVGGHPYRTPTTTEERARALVQAMEDARWDPAAVAAGRGRTRRRAVADILAFAAREVVPRLAGTTDEIDHVVAAAERRLRPGRPLRVPAARPGQRPADRPQLLLRRPQGRPVPPRLGDRPGPGRLPPRALPHGQRRLARPPSACPSGARARCAPPATTSPKRSRCWAIRPVWDDASRRVTGLEADPPRGAGPPPHRRHPAHQRVLPRRLPARRSPCWTTPYGSRPRWKSPPTPTSSAPTPRPTWPPTATNAAPRPASSAPGRGRTERASSS